MFTQSTPPQLQNREGDDLSLLVVEDNHFQREVLRMLLGKAGIDHILEATTVAETLRILPIHTVDVVLLDLRLPDGNGLDLLETIRQRQAWLPVVINSFQHNVPLLVRAFRRGASGYFTKGEHKNDLIAGIRRAASGESAWSTEQLQQIAEWESMVFPRVSGRSQVYAEQH